MTRSLTAILVALSLISTCWAQDEKLDDLSFDEAALQDEAMPYFAIGVGPVFNFAFASTTDINARAKSLGLEEVNSPVFQIGAEIFTAVGIVPNVRFGFSWVSGTSTVSGDVAVNAVNVKRSMAYGITSRAFHLDYALVPIKSLAILPGIGLGWGNHRIEIYQSTPTFVWNPNDSTIAQSPNAYSVIQQSTLYLLPRLNIEYALSPFLNLRAQAAYTWQFNTSDWIGNQHATVTNVPSSISVSGLSLQFGVFVGLFN